MPDGFIELEVLFRGHRFRPDFTKALQILRVLTIDNDRGVSRGFVDDVRRGRVFDVMDLAHIARDHQNLVGLKFHEGGRGNKSIHRHRAPFDFREDIVHFFDARDALERNASVEQTLEVDFVCVFPQEKGVLPHDKSPHGMIDRRVIVVALVDRKL